MSFFHNENHYKITYERNGCFKICKYVCGTYVYFCITEGRSVEEAIENFKKNNR
jgi:hypothetical protein